MTGTAVASAEPATTLSLGPLSRAAGLDLSSYREEHVAERIRRAVERERVAGSAALARLVAGDPAARRRFRRSVAISWSGLFRDPEQFELLEREILPGLLEDGRPMTVWSAGCADGSEVHSVGILLDRAGAVDTARLLGSDVLAENVEIARRADPRVPAKVRARARFEVRDVVRDGAPPGRWRLVLCRNLAIYLTPGCRDALHATLAGALARDGVLMLGRSERLAAPALLGLEPIAPRAYQRRA
jgi:chemotaxis protein methyltransferase CheR